MEKNKIIWLLSFVAVITFSTIVGSMYSYGNEVIEKGETMYMVSHSEYWSGEEGQVIARLYNWQGNPIIVDNCTVDIYYPDKTLFISGGVTDDSLQATTGTHYYNFTTPATEGVYQYYATCNYNSNSRTVASSFHLSPALNFQLNINNSITTLTAQELAHYITVTDNLTTIRDELVIVDTNVDELIVVTGDINTTVNAIDTNIDDLVLTVNDINFSANQLILDVAGVQTDTTYIRNEMMTQDNITIITDNQADISNNLTAIQQFCDDATTSTSQLCVWVSSINDQVIEINQTLGTYTILLNDINTTTTNTYDYMTGTLAGNINTLLGTTARTEETAAQINSTVNTINTNVDTVITNQEDVVYMEVTS